MLSPQLLKKIQAIYIKSRFLATDVFTGEYESAFRGRGIEFEEVREYYPGDDIRSIHWPITARMDKPYVKVYREEREQTLLFVVDASASENFGSQTRPKKEIIAEIAALLAYTANRSNDKVGLVIFSDHVEKYIPPKKGKSHVWHVISELLSFEPKGHKTNLKEALQFVDRICNRRSICFVISDFLATGYEKALRVLNFRHDVVSFTVTDPLEHRLPVGGLMTFRDLETGEVKTLDFGQAKSRALYEARQKKKFEDLRLFFLSLDMDFLLVKTDEDYIEPLLRFFRLREKRL